jgi:hypothetical protein
MKLKSPIQSQGETKSSRTVVRESQKASLLHFSGKPYIQDRIQGELGGSEKYQAEMLFWFVRKHSSSTPNLQARTRPPLSTNRSNMIHQIKAKTIQNGGDKRGRRFCFREKKNIRTIDSDQCPETTNCNRPRNASAVPRKDLHLLLGDTTWSPESVEA